MIKRTLLYAGLAIMAICTPAAATRLQPPVNVADWTTDLKGQYRPQTFTFQTATEIGDGTSCVVGADIAGIALKRAVVLRIDRATNKIIWNKLLMASMDNEGSRATHCAVADGALYVLIQREQTTPDMPPQNAIAVAKFDLNGNQKMAEDITRWIVAKDEGKALGDRREHNSWVEPVAGTLQLTGNEVVISTHHSVSAYVDGKFTQTAPKPIEIRLDKNNLAPADWTGDAERP